MRTGKRPLALTISPKGRGNMTTTGSMRLPLPLRERIEVRGSFQPVKNLLIIFFIFILTLTLASKAPAADGKWGGVDESVVEKFAEEAGRPARKPFINTDQGDLLLFVFLLAGAIGGFIAGYYFRTLFPPKSESPKESSNV